MLPSVEPLLAEIDVEAPATRRVLERVPADRFDWRPHPKSLSAGQLAQHIAAIPGNIARIVQLDGFDLSTRPVEYPSAENPAELLETLDSSVSTLREVLTGLDAERATALWRLSFGEREIFKLPRLGVIRRMCLNHWYHHRGELLVYLRLLDIPVPVVYGRSADENPFGQATA